MLRLRLTMLTAGALLCSLPLGDVAVVAPAPVIEVDAADLALSAGGCNGFTASDVLRGRIPRNGPTCRPIGMDGGVVRSPIAKAKKRDRRNYGRRVHGSRHRGTDFRARCGTKVRASHAGKVVVLSKPRGKRTATVGVSTGPRRLTTWYRPLRDLKVREGMRIRPRRMLGRVARPHAGRCHLHFAVRLRAGPPDSTPVNASRWLRRNRGAHVGGMAPVKRRRGAFVAATLNVLGHSHTAPGGKKRRRYAASPRRMSRAVSLLRSNRVDVVGLQELQRVQRRAFLRRTKGWGLFSPRDPQDSIAWRTKRFRLVRSSTFKIPYFRRMRPMPRVVLRDRATGRRLNVMSVHNPAGEGRTMRKRRAHAVSREVRAVRKVRRRTKAPVLLVGDFNTESRRFYCRMRRSGLTASSGGTRARGCRTSQVAGIDWIFASRGIRFQGHLRMQGGLVRRTTDHPFVLARVRR